MLVIITGPPDAPPTSLTAPLFISVNIHGLIEDNGLFPGYERSAYVNSNKVTHMG